MCSICSNAFLWHVQYFLGLVYTWRSLTGVKLNNNRTQYTRTSIFDSATKTLSLNYTKCKVFR